MADSGHPFSGVLFAGVMITAKGPELIEYNVRFGDPECQVLMMRLKSDLLPILHAAATGRLADMAAEWRDDAALTVVVASKGYPAAYDKGQPIAGLPADTESAKVFHAGTALKDGKLVATGGASSMSPRWEPASKTPVMRPTRPSRPCASKTASRAPTSAGGPSTGNRNALQQHAA